MGGVRQQFSSAHDVALVRESIAFLLDCPPARFEQVGYLFLATSEQGLAELEARRELQRSLGVPVERCDPASVPGLEASDVLGAVFCAPDGVADPLAATREIVRRAAALGVEVVEHTDAEALLDGADTLVIACGAWSAALAARVGVELPVEPARTPAARDRPACRACRRCCRWWSRSRAASTSAAAASGSCSRCPMASRASASRPPSTSRSCPDRLERLAHRYPPAAGAVDRRRLGGALRHDPRCPPDPRDRSPRASTPACGFSGHGFMQSPAVGRALAQEILEGVSELDLGPFRLDRFAGGGQAGAALVL